MDCIFQPEITYQKAALLLNFKTRAWRDFTQIKYSHNNLWLSGFRGCNHKNANKRFVFITNFDIFMITTDKKKPKFSQLQL